MSDSFAIKYFIWQVFSCSICFFICSLRWRHNGRDSVSNHQPHDCLLSRLFRRRSKKTSKLRVTGLCSGNSPGTGEIPAQMASYAENVSIWCRHHVFSIKNNICDNNGIFEVNVLTPSDAIRRHETWTTLVWVMTYTENQVVMTSSCRPWWHHKLS